MRDPISDIKESLWEDVGNLKMLFQIVKIEMKKMEGLVFGKVDDKNKTFDVVGINDQKQKKTIKVNFRVFENQNPEIFSYQRMMGLFYLKQDDEYSTQDSPEKKNTEEQN